MRTPNWTWTPRSTAAIHWRTGRPICIRDINEDYYDSDDADIFYGMIWGGEDLHVGIHEPGLAIAEASDLTVDRMAAMLPALDAEVSVLDIGPGYGGSMRRLAKRFGNHATCLNISSTQNDTNRMRNRRAGLTERVRVLHGVFESIPEPSASHDVVWSQDAILHSAQRDKVLEEVWRVLKPGGHFVLTDPMQSDDVPDGVLQPVYDRLQLNSLGSPRFYRECAQALGFEVLAQEDMTGHLRTHYDHIHAEPLANRDRLRTLGASGEYLDRMALGLENWVKAADAGHLAWGIQLFRKPG